MLGLKKKTVCAYYINKPLKNGTFMLNLFMLVLTNKLKSTKISTKILTALTDILSNRIATNSDNLRHLKSDL